MQSTKSNKMEIDIEEDEGRLRNDTLDGSKSAKKENLMWIEKYRPETLDKILAHDDVISTIKQLIKAENLPNLLLYGPPGTGKTTTILACARALNGPSWQSMTLELNASDERGIDVIREQIKTFASTQHIFNSGFKLIILDEADAMTPAAQFALRRVMEKYTKNTRFCMICNYVNKIIPALQSRCTKFRFAPLQPTVVETYLKKICESEQVTYDEKAIKWVTKLSQGDMRKCLNILQATHSGYTTVNIENVHASTGAPLPRDIEQILKWLLNEEFNSAFSNIRSLQTQKGLALTDIIVGIHELVLRMTINPPILCETLWRLAELENRLTVSTNEKIQLTSLVGIFQIVRAQLYQKVASTRSPNK